MPEPSSQAQAAAPAEPLPRPIHSRRFRYGLPLAVFLASLPFTLGFWQHSRQLHQREIRATLDQMTRDAASRIEARLLAYQHSLVATRGIFQVTGFVGRQDFAASVAALQLEPGIQGVGYSSFVKSEEKPQHTARIRKEGFPDYQIRPSGDRPTYAPVIYLEPFQGRNIQAFGYDIFSEPVRREALIRAMETNQATMTGLVHLVQETPADPQPGVLIYVPVYRKGHPLDSVEARRKALIGWVSAPFRMHDLILSTVGDPATEGLDLEVFDGAPSPESVLYDSDAVLRSPQGSSLAPASTSLTFGGRSWTAIGHALPPLLARHPSHSLALLLLGSLVNVLPGTIAFLVVRHVEAIRAANEELEHRVEARTRALQESLAKNHALLSAIPDLIFMNSRDGDYLAVYASDPRLLLLPEAAFLHRRVQEVLPEALGASFMAAFHRALDTNTVQELSYPLLVAGQERHFEARVAPGTQDTLITIIRDVTQQTQAEAEKARLQAQLQQSQKMESLGNLAGGMAHDMNNVLGAILGMASASLETVEPQSPAYHAFETITKAARRGGKMVQGLLNFARQGPGDQQPFDLNETIREEAQLLERTTLANIHLKLDLAEGLPPVLGEASAVANAIMNLCVNAVDAMSQSGTLTLRTRSLGGEEVEISVEDTGSGMPKEVLERALDPFFTTKAVGKGTGLGLSMVYSIVKAHHGSMDIQSEPGHGTRVILRLPIGPATPGGGDLLEPPIPATAPRQAMTILLVDDDDLIQSSTMAILEALGHQATAVGSGEEALAKLEAGFQPDAIILDMNMPGLGGAGTLPRLRALDARVPVLLATGRADQATTNLVAAHPGVTLLAKPYGMAALQQHLAALRRA